MNSITWTYETRPLSELTQNPINPRQLSKKNAAELKKSLGKFGLCEPIVIQPSGKIIGGHQRVKTLASLGFKETSVAIPTRELSDEEEAELTIRLNKSVGEWDYDSLANNWNVEELLDWGFDMEELHIESIPEQKEEPKNCQLIAKFENEDDLREAEIDISVIIDKYASASYKVKVK